MKKAIAIIVFGLLLSGNAYADEFKDKDLNDVVKQGYKITFVNHHVNFETMYYTLEKDDEVVVCTVYYSKGKTSCWKP